MKCHPRWIVSFVKVQIRDDFVEPGVIFSYKPSSIIVVDKIFKFIDCC